MQSFYLVSTTKVEILSFLGVAGFLCSWSSSFSLFAFHLYKAALGPSYESLFTPIPKPLHKCQQALLHSPTLNIPDLTHSFSLYHRKRGICSQLPGPPTENFLCTHHILTKEKKNTGAYCPRMDTLSICSSCGQTFH